MDIKIATANYRSSKWMEIMRDRKNSGLTVKDYCQLKDISRHAYYYWQRKLRKSACTKLAKQEAQVNLPPPGWAKLSPELAGSLAKSIEVEVSGCSIKVSEDTNLDLLKNICSTLRSMQ